MSNEFSLTAVARTDLGKGASRRLRRLADLMPAVIYGGETEPESISIPHKDMLRVLKNEAFYSHVLSITVDGKEQQVVIKDLQRHPAKVIYMHADFLRVDANRKLHVQVPIHFINEENSPAVKLGGANVSHLQTQVEVSCLPADLPEFIECDLGNAEIGSSVHLSDLVLPEGVESIELSHGESHDQAIASFVAPKGTADDEDEDAAAAGDAEPAADED